MYGLEIIINSSTCPSSAQASPRDSQDTRDTTHTRDAAQAKGEKFVRLYALQEDKPDSQTRFKAR